MENSPTTPRIKAVSLKRDRKTVIVTRLFILANVFIMGCIVILIFLAFLYR